MPKKRNPIPIIDELKRWKRNCIATWGFFRPPHSLQVSPVPGGRYYPMETGQMGSWFGYQGNRMWLRMADAANSKGLMDRRKQAGEQCHMAYLLPEIEMSE
jgi:hypothetical protein